jgi:hypothetical protein
MLPLVDAILFLWVGVGTFILSFYQRKGVMRPSIKYLVRIACVCIILWAAVSLVLRI